LREEEERGVQWIRASQHAFNLDHYHEVMGSFVNPTTGNNLAATPVPANPISRSVFDQYKATFCQRKYIQKHLLVLHGPTTFMICCNSHDMVAEGVDH
jgi:hypothetical protein